MTPDATRVAGRDQLVVTGWDHAGAVPADWEMANALMSWSETIDGAGAPDPVPGRAFLAAYRRRVEAPERLELRMFTAGVSAWLNWTATRVMIVLDGDEDDEQFAKARRNVPGPVDRAAVARPARTVRGRGRSMSGWWLDERAHAGDEHLDATYVSGYDRKSGYDPAEDVEALRRHGLGPGSSVVDLGAGTGTFACAVAPWCGRVVAVDVSPAMVAALRERVAGLVGQEGGLANVRVVEAGFLSYEHDGGPVDFVFTRNALHQSPTSGRRSPSTGSPGCCAPGACCG